MFSLLYIVRRAPGPVTWLKVPWAFKGQPTLPAAVQELGWGLTTSTHGRARAIHQESLWVEDQPVIPQGGKSEYSGPGTRFNTLLSTWLSYNKLPTVEHPTVQSKGFLLKKKKKKERKAFCYSCSNLFSLTLERQARGGVK